MRTGRKVFYRFDKPADPSYPAMLELFSRNPDDLVLGDDSHLTPIPVAEDVSSLSAILLNEDYYGFLHARKRNIGGVPVVGEECLIPLKARAWLDLTARKEAGEHVDSRDIKNTKTTFFVFINCCGLTCTLKCRNPLRRISATFLQS